jgi:pimeloyl-ACP methyl ester carboxylesterase
MARPMSEMTQRLDRRLTLADRTEIAFAIEGHGPAAVLSPAVVLTNGVTTNTEFWRYLEPRFARTHRVLLWDLPGHGASSPARSTRTADLATQPEIIVQLMDRAGLPSAVQIGWSTGCQVVLELYRRHPERCSALVLLLGSAGRTLSTTKLPLSGATIERIARGMPAALFGVLVRAMTGIVNGPGGQFLPRHFNLIGPDTSREDGALITEHLTRVDPRTVQRMIASAEAHSAWDVLDRIHVPVLIVAGDRDPFAPAYAVGEKMHARLPAAHLVHLPRGTHTALLDHADVIGDAVEEFLSTR